MYGAFSFYGEMLGGFNKFLSSVIYYWTEARYEIYLLTYIIKYFWKKHEIYTENLRTSTPPETLWAIKRGKT